ADVAVRSKSPRLPYRSRQFAFSKWRDRGGKRAFSEGIGSESETFAAAQLSGQGFHASGQCFTGDCTIRRSLAPSSGFSRGRGKYARCQGNGRSASVRRSEQFDIV